MRTRPLSVLPLILFILLVLSVSYFIWKRWDTNFVTLESTTTPTLQVPITLPPSPTTQSRPTPLIIPTGILTVITDSPIITQILTPTPTFTIRPTATPVSYTATLTNTPTPNVISGMVIVPNLNVRYGPSGNYLIVAGLKQGDEVTILRSTPPGADVGDWLEVETPNKRIGWVLAKYIKVLGDSTPPTAPVEPTPTPRPTVTISGPLLNLRRELDINGGSVSGEIAPHQEQWYTFFDEDVETVVIFIFKPNLNVYGTSFRVYNVQFFLHDENQIPSWPPTDAEALEDVNIGAGSYEGDRDRDYKTGELVWRGGPLIPEVLYYLRFVNRSSEPIQYCLIPRDVREWTCSKN